MWHLSDKGQSGIELAGAVTMLSSLGSLIMLVLPNPVTEFIFSLIDVAVYY